MTSSHLGEGSGKVLFFEEKVSVIEKTLGVLHLDYYFFCLPESGEEL